MRPLARRSSKLGNLFILRRQSDNDRRSTILAFTRRTKRFQAEVGMSQSQGTANRSQGRSRRRSRTPHVKGKGQAVDHSRAYESSALEAKGRHDKAPL